jgi:hypothetical protein
MTSGETGQVASSFLQALEYDGVEHPRIPLFSTPSYMLTI